MGDWKALPRGSFFRSARLDCALSLLSGAMVREEKRGKIDSLQRAMTMASVLKGLR